MPNLPRKLICACLLLLLAACGGDRPANDTADAAGADNGAGNNGAVSAAEIPTIAGNRPDELTPLPAEPVRRVDLPAQWLGTWQHGDERRLLSLHLADDDPAAAILVRHGGVGLSRATAQLALNEATGAFTLAADLEGETFTLAGQIRPDLIQGYVNGADDNPVAFIPLVEVDLAPYVGLYAFADGHTVSISQSPGGALLGSGPFLPGLWYVSHEEGAYRPLSPLSAADFVMGPVLGFPVPGQATVRFEWRGGQVTGFVLQPTGAAPQTAARVPLVEEEVRFSGADGVDLAGTFSVPAGDGPYPAVVLVHGSGRTTRAMLLRLTHFMLSNDVAVLAYDKRGVGESDGVYMEAASDSNLRRLAGDAAAGVDWLAGQPAVAANRIGFYGSSQAGWIIPLAALLTDNAAFAIILSGPVVTVGQEGAYSAITGNGAVTPNLSAEEIDARIHAAGSSGFDPYPHIVDLEIPVLWLFGARDKSIPVPQSVTNLESIIADTGHALFSYYVFDDGDHALWSSPTGNFSDWPAVTNLSAGVYDRQREWLRDAGIVE